MSIIYIVGFIVEDPQLPTPSKKSYKYGLDTLLQEGKKKTKRNEVFTY